MSKYADTHLAWATGVLLYFAGGAVLCSLILSVPGSATGYHIAVIVYTLVGLGLMAAWISAYTNDPSSPSLLGSTSSSISPAQDREYGVVHSLFVNSSIISIGVVFLFWIWFLIYLYAVQQEELQRVLDVYSVVLLPFTFFTLLFFLASWWIPAAARTPCSSHYVHPKRSCSSSSTPSELVW